MKLKNEIDSAARLSRRLSIYELLLNIYFSKKREGRMVMHIKADENS